MNSLYLLCKLKEGRPLVNQQLKVVLNMTSNDPLGIENQIHKKSLTSEEYVSFIKKDRDILFMIDLCKLQNGPLAPL